MKETTEYYRIGKDEFLLYQFVNNPYNNQEIWEIREVRTGNTMGFSSKQEAKRAMRRNMADHIAGKSGVHVSIIDMLMDVQERPDEGAE